MRLGHSYEMGKAIPSADTSERTTSCRWATLEYNRIRTCSTRYTKLRSVVKWDVGSSNWRGWEDVETIGAAADVMRRWIEAYAPLALYTDWRNGCVADPTRTSWSWTARR